MNPQPHEEKQLRAKSLQEEVDGQAAHEIKSSTIKINKCMLKSIPGTEIHSVDIQRQQAWNKIVNCLSLRLIVLGLTLCSTHSQQVTRATISVAWTRKRIWRYNSYKWKQKQASTENSVFAPGQRKQESTLVGMLTWEPHLIRIYLDNLISVMKICTTTLSGSHLACDLCLLGNCSPEEKKMQEEESTEGIVATSWGDKGL